jgi:exosome complex component RRP45
LQSSHDRNTGRIGDVSIVVDNVNISPNRPAAHTHSNALDTESLCILKGVSCWSIRADVHVIDYDGNITDAMLSATGTRCSTP